MKRLLFNLFKKLKPALLHGRLSFVACFIYNSVISIDLCCVRIVDLLYKPEKKVDLSKLTAVIKTFERPKELRRLIKSIRRFYPELEIIVIDDSKEPGDVSGVKVIKMPFNSGLSAGRNKALEYIDTEFLLLLDDDFIFSRYTDLNSAMQIMEENLEIDILGGSVVDLPFFIEHDYTKSNSLFSTDVVPKYPAGSTIAGLPVYDKVPNFFIARTDRIKLVKWDERLKKIEHADFFTRAKGVLITVFNRNLKVFHAKTPFYKDYMRFRNDLSDERSVLKQKYFRERSADKSVS